MAHMLERIGFLNETWLKTNMAKTTGWAPRRQRLVDHAPFGHWRTQTFISTLALIGWTRPFAIVLEPMAQNGSTFETYVETQLARTLCKGIVIILDNLSSYKSEGLRDIGAWFVFLAPYSPDLNPIEMAFSKLKTLIRKAVARTYDALWNAVGQVCDLATEEKCFNFFKATGYRTD